MSNDYNLREATPINIEIKQIDRDRVAEFGLILGRLTERDADNCRAGKWDSMIDVRWFAAQRQTYEVRIAELERERDAADLSRTAYARALEKMRIALVNVHDGIEDEGDRIYLGSTNHADDLKAAWHAADALQWEAVLADTQPKTDVVKANLHLQSELAAAEARLAEAVELLIAARQIIEGDNASDLDSACNKDDLGRTIRETIDPAFLYVVVPREEWLRDFASFIQENEAP